MIAFMRWFSPHVRGQSGSSVSVRPTDERYFDMKLKSKPELIDKENPEWTEEDFRHAQPASELLPELFGPKAAAEMLTSRGRPKAAETKAHVNIRLDKDVLDAFKAKGRGWQTRINTALREWLHEQESGKSRHT